MSPFIAEILGTAILVLFGNGVVSNVVLAKTKGHGSGWIVIAFGWGMGVFIAVFCVSQFSDAHVIPAVTFGLATGGKLAWNLVPNYIAGQMLGGFLGAIVVYVFYNEHFKATADPDAKLACFCTAPNIRSFPTAFFSETIGTFLLVLPLFLMVSPSLALTPSGTESKVKFVLGAIAALPAGLLAFGIGLSLGGTTGYAINPPRDLSPRIAHAMLPIPGKRDSDWSYAWIPVLGPILGGLLAAGVARALLR